MYCWDFVPFFPYLWCHSSAQHSWRVNTWRYLTKETAWWDLKKQLLRKKFTYFTAHTTNLCTEEFKSGRTDKKLSSDNGPIEIPHCTHCWAGTSSGLLHSVKHRGTTFNFQTTLPLLQRSIVVFKSVLEHEELKAVHPAYIQPQGNKKNAILCTWREILSNLVSMKNWRIALWRHTSYIALSQSSSPQPQRGETPRAESRSEDRSYIRQETNPASFSLPGSA